MPETAASRRWTIRSFAAATALVVGGLLGPAVVPAGANAQDPDAVRAAQEIQAARDRANAASQAMFDAESELDSLELEIIEAERQLAAVEAEAAAMRSNLQADAQRSFANSSTGNPLLVDLDQANDGITADRQASVARGAASVELDDFAVVAKEVSRLSIDLERRQEQTSAAREQYEQLQQNAEAEVVRLTEIEEQRLADVAVQRELERQRQAQLAAEQAENEAAARAARSAAAANASSGSSGGSSGGSASGASAASSRGSSSGGSSSGSSASGSSSGSSASGSSGSGAGASSPPPATVPPSPPPANTGSGIVCPVAGAHAFADTWGAPRSGGRSHQGVDMMASRGTPLVAVESGVANFRNTRLGGKSVGLTGNSGTYYFYAHLDAWAGSSRSVQRGEVIGYVGATGNTTANHLHFEVHPGGGRAVNPYPYVRRVC